MSTTPTHEWRPSIGERCLALWSADGCWYPAQIRAICLDSVDRTVFDIVFDDYDERETVSIASLKQAEEWGADVAAALEKRARLKQQERQQVAPSHQQRQHAAPSDQQWQQERQQVAPSDQQWQQAAPSGQQWQQAVPSDSSVAEELPETRSTRGDPLVASLPSGGLVDQMATSLSPDAMNADAGEHLPHESDTDAVPSAYSAGERFNIIKRGSTMFSVATASTVDEFDDVDPADFGLDPSGFPPPTSSNGMSPQHQSSTPRSHRRHMSLLLPRTSPRANPPGGGVPILPLMTSTRGGGGNADPVPRLNSQFSAPPDGTARSMSLSPATTEELHAFQAAPSTMFVPSTAAPAHAAPAVPSTRSRPVPPPATRPQASMPRGAAADPSSPSNRQGPPAMQAHSPPHPIHQPPPGSAPLSYRMAPRGRGRTPSPGPGGRGRGRGRGRARAPSPGPGGRGRGRTPSPGNVRGRGAPVHGRARGRGRALHGRTPSQTVRGGRGRGGGRSRPHSRNKSFTATSYLRPRPFHGNNGQPTPGQLVSPHMPHASANTEPSKTHQQVPRQFPNLSVPQSALSKRMSAPNIQSPRSAANHKAGANASGHASPRHSPSSSMVNINVGSLLPSQTLRRTSVADHEISPTVSPVPTWTGDHADANAPTPAHTPAPAVDVEPTLGKVSRVSTRSSTASSVSDSSLASTPPLRSASASTEVISTIQALAESPEGDDGAQPQPQPQPQPQAPDNNNSNEGARRPSVAEKSSSSSSSREEFQLSPRDCVASELLDTERTYVSNLLTLQTKFVQPLLVSAKSADPILSEKECDKLFSDVQLLIKLNSEFLEALEDRLAILRARPYGDNTVLRLGDFFMRFAPFFTMYSHYASKHKESDDFLNVLLTKSKNKRFQQFCVEARRKVKSSRSGSSSLQSFLILPIQRLPRYLLLARDLLKETPSDHIDHDDLRQAVDLIYNTTQRVNEAVKFREKFMTLMQLSQEFANDPGFIVPRRYLVRRGQLLKRGVKDAKYEFLLFSDMICYASRPSGVFGSKKLRLHVKIPIDAKFCAESLPDEDVPHVFVITNSAKTFVVAASTLAAKKEWLADIKQCTSQKRDERRRAVEDYDEQLALAAAIASGASAPAPASAKASARAMLVATDKNASPTMNWEVAAVPLHPPPPQAAGVPSPVVLPTTSAAGVTSPLVAEILATPPAPIDPSNALAPPPAGDAHRRHDSDTRQRIERSNKCVECATQFSMQRRRKTCDMCARAVCSDCLTSAIVEQLDPKKTSSICPTCVDTLDADLPGVPRHKRKPSVLLDSIREYYDIYQQQQPASASASAHLSPTYATPTAAAAAVPNARRGVADLPWNSHRGQRASPPAAKVVSPTLGPATTQAQAPPPGARGPKKNSIRRPARPLRPRNSGDVNALGANALPNVVGRPGVLQAHRSLPQRPRERRGSGTPPNAPLRGTADVLGPRRPNAVAKLPPSLNARRPPPMSDGLDAAAADRRRSSLDQHHVGLGAGLLRSHTESFDLGVVGDDGRVRALSSKRRHALVPAKNLSLGADYKYVSHLELTDSHTEGRLRLSEPPIPEQLPSPAIASSADAARRASHSETSPLSSIEEQPPPMSAGTGEDAPPVSAAGQQHPPRDSGPTAVGSAAPARVHPKGRSPTLLTGSSGIAPLRRDVVSPPTGRRPAPPPPGTAHHQQQQQPGVPPATDGSGHPQAQATNPSRSRQAAMQQGPRGRSPQPARGAFRMLPVEPTGTSRHSRPPSRGAPSQLHTSHGQEPHVDALPVDEALAQQFASSSTHAQPSAHTKSHQRPPPGRIRPPGANPHRGPPASPAPSQGGRRVLPMQAATSRQRPPLPGRVALGGGRGPPPRAVTQAQGREQPRPRGGGGPTHNSSPTVGPDSNGVPPHEQSSLRGPHSQAPSGRFVRPKPPSLKRGSNIRPSPVRLHLPNETPSDSSSPFPRANVPTRAADLPSMSRRGPPGGRRAPSNVPAAYRNMHTVSSPPSAAAPAPPDVPLPSETAGASPHEQPATTSSSSGGDHSWLARGKRPPHLSVRNPPMGAHRVMSAPAAPAGVAPLRGRGGVDKVSAMLGVATSPKASIGATNSTSGDTGISLPSPTRASEVTKVRILPRRQQR